MGLAEFKDMLRGNSRIIVFLFSEMRNGSGEFIIWPMQHDGQTVYTPTELNREVRLHLEMGFGRVLIEAEISNLSRPPSGHLYFTLKDARAQIRCALFRSSANRLQIQPENGMKVLARGRISLYEPRGDFQLIVDSMRDAGEGRLQREFEELKKKLETEGLFDPAAKQSLPSFPRKIGVITSPSGAAIRDILHVLERRWPQAEVRIYPASVQGVDAPGELVTALNAANEHDWADVLIIGRGGGSLEDLAAFNDETLARTVHASSIPLVCAVGHETDFSICDFVADLRAPTPSAAAELATPDQAALRQSLNRSGRLLSGRVTRRLQQSVQQLDHLAHRLELTHPGRQLQTRATRLAQLRDSLDRAIRRSLELKSLQTRAWQQRLALKHPATQLRQSRQQVTDLRKQLDKLTSGLLKNRQTELADLARTLNAVSPLATVARGYAIVTRESTGEVVHKREQVRTGERVVTQVRDGRLISTIDAIDSETLNSD